MFPHAIATGDSHDAFLEWLPEGIEHARRELTQLVEKEHAAGCRADLSGPSGSRPSAHEGRH
jgi:hypothetical protein